MKAEQVLYALDQMKELVEKHTDSSGELAADPVRIKIVLEFCYTEINRMIDESKSI